MTTVVPIDRKTICCSSLEALIPGVVPCLVKAATGSGNFGVLGKVMQILWMRNLEYLSFAGVIISAVGTAVGHVQNSPPTEYAFVAVLGISLLSAALCFKRLSDRMEQYLYVVQGFRNERGIRIPPPTLPAPSTTAVLFRTEGAGPLIL